MINRLLRRNSTFHNLSVGGPARSATRAELEAAIAQRQGVGEPVGQEDQHGELLRLGEGWGLGLDGLAFGLFGGGGADDGAAFGDLGGGFFVGVEDLVVVAGIGRVRGEDLAGQGEGDGGAEGEVGADAHEDFVGELGENGSVLWIDGTAGVNLG